MKFSEIKNSVYYCGLNDCERKIFDELIPLEHGTTYNSYLVKGSEKVAIIDTMYPKKTDIYLKNLDENGMCKIFNTFFLDESSVIKNNTTKTYKYTKNICNIVSRVHFMNATTLN